MYKKITHTIVEEHFDNLIGPHTMLRPTLAEIMPADTMKAYVEDYFIGLEEKMVNLANASFDPALDFQAAIGNAMEFEALGNTLEKYYDVEFRERLNQALGNTLMSLLYIWRNIQRRIDNTDNIERLRQNSWGFGMLLNQYNNKWDKDVSRGMLDEWITALISLAAAKNAKNRTAETTALEKLATATNSLSVYLSNGLISQHPELFTQ